MTSDAVPVVRDLAEIYSADALQAERKRWNELAYAFETAYGAGPAWIARAPGRVNVIGDHVDYCGLGCLPAAIQPDVLLAGRSSSASASTSRIRLRSTKPDQYPNELIEISADGKVPLDRSKHSWGNYVRAGLSGVLEAHDADLKAFELDLLCDGNVPAGGGLSSSAAMVIASSLACLKALGQLDSITRTAMTEIAIDSERLVGVNSGGMDQTASVFGERSSLIHIEFVPRLRSRPVAVPTSLAFVIANSLVTSEKQSTAKRHYNLRVVEVRVVATLLAKQLGIDGLPAPPTIKAVLDAMPSESKDEPARLREVLARLDGPGPWQSQRDITPWRKVYEQLGLDEASFERDIQRGIEIEAPDGLKLYKRARHVITESLRVHDACSLLDRSPGSDSLASELGALMSSSQDSLRDFSESSCPECDELIDLARQAGALGSRVTGAGWGGCTVHLVRAGEEGKLVDALRESYYARRYPHLAPADLEVACFATRAERGACMYQASA